MLLDDNVWQVFGGIPIHREYRRKFGDQVRLLRTSLGLSQEQLGFRCGLHRTYIGAIERGDQNIGIDNIVKIANALGVQPSELFPDLED